jgi:hypothetical protein
MVAPPAMKKVNPCGNTRSYPKRFAFNHRQGCSQSKAAAVHAGPTPAMKRWGTGQASPSRPTFAPCMRPTGQATLEPMLPLRAEASPTSRAVELLRALRAAPPLQRGPLADALNECLRRMREPGDDHAETRFLALALEDGDFDGLVGTDGASTRQVALVTLEALGYPQLLLEELGHGSDGEPHWKKQLRWSRAASLVVLCLPGAFVLHQGISSFLHGSATPLLLGLLTLFWAAAPFVWMIVRGTPLDRQAVPVALSVTGVLPASAYCIVAGFGWGLVLALVVFWTPFLTLAWQVQDMRRRFWI